MTDNVIFIKLNEALKKVQKYYNIENIFGILLLDTDKDSIQSEAVIIPSFKEVCTSLDLQESEIEGIKIFDIRKLSKATTYGHPEFNKALDDNKYMIINPCYQHMFQKLMQEKKSEIRAGIGLGIPAPELEIAIMKLCRYVWTVNSNPWHFLKNLSDAEKLALEGIIKAIGDEGTFSQAKVASAVGVSRFTMGNLIMKMKFYEVAEITYFGNKGTYLKFLDDSILDFKSERIRI